MCAARTSAISESESSRVNPSEQSRTTFPVHDQLFRYIRLDFRLDTDAAHEDVAQAADTGLELSDLAAAYLFGD